MRTHHLFLTLVMAVLAIVLFPSCGRSFDTGPHYDLTGDALAAEGFSSTATEVAQVTNWMVDFYEQASQNPFSGYSSWWKELLVGAIGSREHWPETVVNAADWLHFDSTPHFSVAGRDRRLDDGDMIAMEWERFSRATRLALIERANAGDTMGLLVVLGISTHCLQDFYAHSNWVEPTGTAGFDGPGWAAISTYGSHPTYFDVPADVRRTARVYAGTGAPLRGHGAWNSDGNRTLGTAINKDWPGRPQYREAYITAYFATRQWVRAARAWLNNENAWRAAQQYADRCGNELDRDLSGAFKISFNAGHWQGQGEPNGADYPGPGGSLDDLIGVIGEYHRAGKSAFRTKFEQMILAVASSSPPTAAVPVLSSHEMQAETEFVTLKITRVKDATPTLAVGIDPGVDQADFYARAIIDGQSFISGMIHGYDYYAFALPNYPFTFIKALRKGSTRMEPITTLRVTVRTCDVQWAGTDDDVFLRINDAKHFKLDKPLYDDFERGDEDTYSINPAGLSAEDVRFLQIEKAADGAAGGWKLSRVKLETNGAQVYFKDRIDSWLEDDHRSWRARDFIPRHANIIDIPVTIMLYDSDGGLYGADDHCDIHPDFNRRDLNLLFNRANLRYRGDLTGIGTGASRGGSRYGGRPPEGEDDDRCEISFTLENTISTAMPAEPLSVISQLTAAPARHAGRLPVTIVFSGTITVNRACVVRYRLLRSDGSIAPEQTVNFEGPGTKPVRAEWRLGRPMNGWMQLSVNAPVRAESARAEFSIASTSAMQSEDLNTFDWQQAEVRQVNNSWRITAGQIVLKDFGANEAAARQALQIIRQYRLNTQGFVGRPQPSMEYYLVNGAAPVGPMAGEDSIAFNPTSLQVQQIGGRWKIVERDHALLDFDQAEVEARTALTLIRKYGFTHICFVSRPNPPMMYFRK